VNWLLVTAAVGAAVIAAGCGGGDDSSSAVTSSLGKTEFVEQANAACREARSGLRIKASAFLSGQSPDKPPQVRNADLAHFVLLPPIEVQIGGLEELIRRSDLPPAAAGRLEKILDVERNEIDIGATTLRFPSMTAVYRLFDKSAGLFRVFGLTSCANSPKPPVRLR